MMVCLRAKVFESYVTFAARVILKWLFVSLKYDISKAHSFFMMWLNFLRRSSGRGWRLWPPVCSAANSGSISERCCRWDNYGMEVCVVITYGGFWTLRIVRSAASCSVSICSCIESMCICWAPLTCSDSTVGSTWRFSYSMLDEFWVSSGYWTYVSSAAI